MRRALIQAAALAALGPAVPPVAMPPEVVSPAQMAAINSKIPAPSATAPMPDSTTGSAGSGTHCTPRLDATRPLIPAPARSGR